MTEKRKTYRHRNSKTHWAVPDLIHTFWVGQRVARSWERVNYSDLIGELGTVVAIPEKQGGNLTVKVGDDLHQWSPTEAIPLRRLLERNRTRFQKVAKALTEDLNSLDENGMPRKEMGA